MDVTILQSGVPFLKTQVIKWDPINNITSFDLFSKNSIYANTDLFKDRDTFFSKLQTLDKESSAWTIKEVHAKGAKVGNSFILYSLYEKLLENHHIIIQEIESDVLEEDHTLKYRWVIVIERQPGNIIQWFKWLDKHKIKS